MNFLTAWRIVALLLENLVNSIIRGKGGVKKSSVKLCCSAGAFGSFHA